MSKDANPLQETGAETTAAKKGAPPALKTNSGIAPTRTPAKTLAENGSRPATADIVGIRNTITRARKTKHGIVTPKMSAPIWGEPIGAEKKNTGGAPPPPVKHALRKNHGRAMIPKRVRSKEKPSGAYPPIPLSQAPQGIQSDPIRVAMGIARPIAPTQAKIFVATTDVRGRKPIILV